MKILILVVVLMFITATSLFAVISDIPAYYSEWNITAMLGLFAFLVAMFIIALLKTKKG